MLSHFYPSLSISSSLGAPSFTHSPLLSFLKSLALSFYSLLLCCIPVSVVKGVDKEEGGKKRKGELELYRGEGEGERERGKEGPFLYENAFCREC